jgi:hypothetical protein
VRSLAQSLGGRDTGKGGYCASVGSCPSDRFASRFARVAELQHTAPYDGSYLLLHVPCYKLAQSSFKCEAQPVRHCTCCAAVACVTLSGGRATRGFWTSVPALVNASPKLQSLVFHNVGGRGVMTVGCLLWHLQQQARCSQTSNQAALHSLFVDTTNIYTLQTARLSGQSRLPSHGVLFCR